MKCNQLVPIIHFFLHTKPQVIGLIATTATSSRSSTTPVHQAAHPAFSSGEMHRIFIADMIVNSAYTHAQVKAASIKEIAEKVNIMKDTLELNSISSQIVLEQKLCSVVYVEFVRLLRRQRDDRTFTASHNIWRSEKEPPTIMPIQTLRADNLGSGQDVAFWAGCRGTVMEPN